MNSLGPSDAPDNLPLATHHCLPEQCFHCGENFFKKKIAPTTASTDAISLCVASLTTQRFFFTSPCGARTTNKEIILNLNVWGKEERKRTVLTSSRKGEDILYPPQMELCLFLINLVFLCLFLKIFFYVESQHFWSKLIINVSITNHIIFLLYEENIYMWDSVRRKMLSVSPATNILIFQPWGKA